MGALRAKVARLQELVAVKDRQLSTKEAQLAAKDNSMASQVEETKLLKRELQLRVTSSDACDCAHLDGHPKRQRTHDSSSSNSSSPERACALDRDEVLDQIFSYVGGGEHLYIAGVSRRWRGRYLRFCVLSSTKKYHKKLVTKHGSTLMTESRLKLAFAAGLSVKGWNLSKTSRADSICKYSIEPERVMTLLRLHGVPWDAALCNAAAIQAKLPLLQWLRDSSCPWKEVFVLLNASRGGSVPMLEWLATVTQPWSEKSKADMMADAASCNELAAAQWLRGCGATWPVSFVSELSSNGVTLAQCWSVSAVQWAVAAGSGWLRWEREDYAADKYHHGCDRRQASALLKWAHANGCPCTCGHQQQQHQQQQQQQQLLQ
jgi:hypothetical protein